MKYTHLLNSKFIAVFTFFIILPIIGFAQESVIPNLPPSPEASGLGKVTEVPIGEYTGSFNYAVPIKTLGYKGVSVPISLGYQSGGIRVSDEASQVGLGWNLNAGGVITRSIRGGDDFGGTGNSGNFDTGVVGYLSMINSNRVPNAPSSVSVWRQLNNNASIRITSCDPSLDCYFEDDFPIQDNDICPAGSKDMESDLYSFNFLGYSGKFVIDRDGSFKILDNQNLKIELSLSEDNDYHWVITDSEGITYYFGTHDNTRQVTWTKSVAYSNVNNGGWNYNEPGLWSSEYSKYLSAWYIEKIELPNKKQGSNDREVAATFTYAPKGDGSKRIVSIPTFSESDAESIYCDLEELTRIQNCSFSPPNIPTKSSIRSINTLEYDNVELEAIQTPFEKLDFSYSNRTDLVHAKKIDAISHFTFKGSTFNYQGQTVFDYYTTEAPKPSAEGTQWHELFPYSTTVQDNVDPDANRQRLMLKSVTQIGKNGESLPSYEFVYDETLLPAKTSFATDSRGYYNGLDGRNPRGGINTTFLPPHMEYGVDVNGQTRDIIIPGADKSVSVDYAKAQHLLQIISPLGGSSTFTLEGNDYFVDDYEELTLRGSKSLGVQMSGSCWTNINSLNNSGAFTVDNGRTDGVPAMVRFKLDWTRFEECFLNRGGQTCNTNYCLAGGYKFNVYLKNSSGDTVRRWDSGFAGIVESSTQAFVNHLGVDYFDLPNGDYSFSFKTNIPGHSLELPSDFAFLGINLSWTKYSYIGNKLSGGLRVETTTYCPTDGPEIIYAYKYEDENGNSTGLPVNLPRQKISDPERKIVYHDCDPDPNRNNFAQTEVTCLYIRRSSQSFTPLSTSMFGSFTGYSKVTKLHGLEGENGKSESVYYNRPHDLIPALDFDNYFAKSGLTGFRTQRNGRLESNSLYSKEGTLMQETTNTYAFETIIGEPVWFFRIINPDNFNVDFEISDGGNPPIFSSACGATAPVIIAYQDIPEWNQLLSTTTKTYDQYGQNFTTSGQSQTYDQENFNLKSQTVWGPGGSKETEYFYPTDIGGPVALLATNHHMVGVPVRVKNPDGTETIIHYDLSKLIPYKISTKYLDNTVISQGEIVSFNQDDLPETVKVHGFTNPQVFVWSGDQLLLSKTFIKHRQSYTYNDARQVATIKDIDGQVMSYEYDGLNRLKKVIARNGKITTDFAYLIGGGDNSTTKTTTFADAGTVTETSYFDGMGRPVSTEVNGVEKNRQSYDAFGRVDQQLYMPGYGNTQVFYEKSPLSRVMETIFPDGKKVLTEHLVEEGFPTVATTDEVGNITKSQTDVFGRIRKQIDADGGATVYTYTDFDAPKIVQPPGGDPYVYTYYKRGNLLESKTIPDGGKTTYYYDNGHRILATKLPNGTTIRMAYDAYGREKQTSRSGNYQPWGTTLNSLPSPLTRITYNPDNIHAAKTGTVLRSEAALLLPNGGQGSMVTTNYTAYDPYARVLAYNDRYTLDGQTRVDEYTMTLNHRDLVTQSVQTGFGGRTIQDFGFDDFSRPTRVGAFLEYGNAANYDDSRADMNVSMEYNTADQMTERRLLEARRGFYGETLKYDHPRGWLTAINRPSSRSFDAFLCEEPVGDVYVPEPITQTTDLQTIFGALADGSYVSVSDLECEEDIPDAPECQKPTDVKDYLVSVSNPIKIGKGEFANAAKIPCPVGSSCSSLDRAENLSAINDISITGVTVVDGGAPVNLILGAPYDLNDILLSQQTRGINHPELDRFKREVIYAAATNGWYIGDIDFSIDSDASNCTKCVAGGNKNYNIDITFSKSAVRVAGIEVNYAYDLVSNPKGNEYVWPLPTGETDPRIILGPCDVKPNEDDKPEEDPKPEGGKSLNSNITVKPATRNIFGTQWRRNILGGAAGAKTADNSNVGWLDNGQATQLRFYPQKISTADSLKLIAVVPDGCGTSDPLKGSAGSVVDKANNLGVGLFQTRILQLNSFFGRELPPLKGVEIKLTGAPFRFYLGEQLTDEALAQNLTEGSRLEGAFQEWLDEHSSKQQSTVKVETSSLIRIALTSGPLELVFADYRYQYEVEIKCPESTTKVKVDGTVDRVTAYRTASAPAPFHPGMLNQEGVGISGGKDDQKPKSDQRVGDKDDGLPICPDQPDPVCTPAEQAAQLDQVTNFYASTDSAYLASINYPTTLYAVELCDGSIAYLLEDQLNSLVGDYNIRGQMPISSEDQEIRATLGIGPNPLFSMNLDYYANGNIKTSRWKTTYHAPNVYRYKYDKLNRLESAQYNPSNAGPGLGAEGIFSVSGITYDGIGNILTLNRQGVTPCGGPGGTELIVNAIDQLSYRYENGSRLSEVVDNATHPDLKNLGVKNGGGTYQYDAAGRMTHDNHRGLVIEYNHLDLPRRITLQNGEVIEITYDATGRKWLQKKDCDDSRIYAGSVVLVADKCDYYLESVNTSDGRLVYDPEAGQVYPEFFHKDHLGNVRLAFTDRNKDGKVELLGPTSEITQQNDYYPFGMRQEGDSLVFHQELGSNRYRFNGKEFSEELGLYDYGARWYDPAVARWTSIDPLASSMASWSPYNYVYNNPIIFTDPTGMAPFTELFDKKGNKIGEDANGNDGNVSIITNKDDAKRIKGQYKSGGVASAEDVAGGLQTTKAVLGETLNVIERTESNGGLREEVSVVTGDGNVVRGETGPEPRIENIGGVLVQTAEATVPTLSEGTNESAATLIHSHPLEVVEQDGQAFPQSANTPSGADRRAFPRFGTNVIAGPLGVVTRITRNSDGSLSGVNRSTGAVFYNGASAPQGQVSKRAIRKIVND